MGFFGGKEDGKKDESQRLTGRVDSTKVSAATPPMGTPTLPPRRVLAIRSFLLGLATSDKLVAVATERLEEGLRAALPKDARVRRIESPPGHEQERNFEVTLGSGDMTEALAAICEKGILDGYVQVSLDQCLVVCRAEAHNTPVNLLAETMDRMGARFTVHAESTDVQIQYPPVEVHRRWAPDDDYKATYERWRAQRSEPDPSKTPRWSAGWPGGASDDQGNPPWVKVRAREGKPNEHVVEFDDRVFLRFAVHGADITINRFNLKILVNKVTSEYAVYRSLPLSLETMPKEIQDRIAREPERFKPLREPGRFGASFDLVRQAYEEAGGDYFQYENPSTPPRPAKAAAPSQSFPRPVEAAPAAAAESGSDGKTGTAARPRPSSTPAPTGRPVKAPTSPGMKAPLKSDGKVEVTKAFSTPAVETTKAFSSGSDAGKSATPATATPRPEEGAGGGEAPASGAP